MPEAAPLDLPDNPRLTHNIAHFARALRKAGLPAGPGRVIDAIRAVEAAGFTSKADFFYTRSGPVSPRGPNIGWSLPRSSASTGAIRATWNI